MKKYRLEIPENELYKDPQWEFLKNINGKIVKIEEQCGECDYLVSQFYYDYPVFKVWYEWLEEIKEPVVLSAEDFARHMTGIEIGTQSFKECTHSANSLLFREQRFSMIINRVSKDSFEAGERKARIELKPLIKKAKNVVKNLDHSKAWHDLKGAIAELEQALEKIPPLED